MGAHRGGTCQRDLLWTYVQQRGDHSEQSGAGLYTVANSGNYTVENPDEAGLDNMTKLFIGVDVAIAVILIAAETIVVLRWKKKRAKTITVESKENSIWN